mmetsp:Transcript_81783/g.237119  ORF Transcript_81783/g.237119 Transcript_81783/m.237119 type:complete len:275 (+) Transcript_81783:938-1762(+)
MPSLGSSIPSVRAARRWAILFLFFASWSTSLALAAASAIRMSMAQRVCSSSGQRSTTPSAPSTMKVRVSSVRASPSWRGAPPGSSNTMRGFVRGACAMASAAARRRLRAHSNGNWTTVAEAEAAGGGMDLAHGAGRRCQPHRDASLRNDAPSSLMSLGGGMGLAVWFDMQGPMPPTSMVSDHRLSRLLITAECGADGNSVAAVSPGMASLPCGAAGSRPLPNISPTSSDARNSGNELNVMLFVARRGARPGDSGAAPGKSGGAASSSSSVNAGR